MFSTKPILQFLIVFILSYGILMVLGSLSEEGYAERFRAFGKTFFHDFGKKGMVWFEVLKDPTEKHFNTKIRLLNKHQYEDSRMNKTRLKTGTVTASSWYTGFLPTILVISLVLAAPVPFKRRMWALFWGLMVVHLFIWFQLYIQIVHEFDQNPFLEIVQLKGFGKSVVNSLHYLFVESMGTTFVVPVFVWLVVTFRKGDVESILQLKTS